MESLVSMLWDLLTAAGGTVALALIAAIALGINAMTLIFAGSAVVALERFARVARRTRSLVGFGALWALLLGALVLYARAEELAGDRHRRDLAGQPRERLRGEVGRRRRFQVAGGAPCRPPCQLETTFSGNRSRRCPYGRKFIRRSRSRNRGSDLICSSIGWVLTNGRSGHRAS